MSQLLVVETARVKPRSRKRGRWARRARFVFITVFTLFALFPLLTVVLYAFRPSTALVSGGSQGFSFTLANFRYVFSQTEMLLFLRNSVIVSCSTALVAVIVGAPAGYVLSRSRHKLLSIYSVILFVVQGLPVVVFLIPLFLLYVHLGLQNSLQGVVVAYVAISVPFAIWMMRSYFDSIPVEIEEASWVDGCSVVSAFVRVILPNAGPGILAAAIFSFLVAWNDYIIADVMLRSTSVTTMGIGLESLFTQYSAAWGAIMASSLLMMAPPLIVFAIFNRYFSLGGVAGSLGGS